MLSSLPSSFCPAGLEQLASILRRHAALCLAGALLLAQLPACATRLHADRQPVSMSIVDRETGQVMTAYRMDGRTYVAGRPGSRYAIRLANQTGGRVMVVLSVDGVNVITGETASVGQTGYVLDPWRSYDIAGWRKSDTAIASFVFAALDESYAARTGRAGNVGVIGMAAFLEKPEPQAMRQRHDPPTTADRFGSAGKAESRVDAAHELLDAARDGRLAVRAAAGWHGGLCGIAGTPPARSHSLPDGLLMMSFPRAGQVCAAQILAELGDVRERFPNAELLAAEAGAVPVTYQSGKTRSVAFRWACNHRLRQAITCLADNSRRANDWARSIYQAARARGSITPTPSASWLAPGCA